MNTFNNIIGQGYNIKDILILQDANFVLMLENGTSIFVAKKKFERLKNATFSQLKEWKLVSSGLGVTWTNLNEDISISGILTELRDQVTKDDPTKCKTCGVNNRVLEYA